MDYVHYNTAIERSRRDNHSTARPVEVEERAFVAEQLTAVEIVEHRQLLTSDVRFRRVIKLPMGPVATPVHLLDRHGQACREQRPLDRRSRKIRAKHGVREENHQAKHKTYALAFAIIAISVKLLLTLARLPRSASCKACVRALLRLHLRRWSLGMEILFWITAEVRRLLCGSGSLLRLLLRRNRIEVSGKAVCSVWVLLR